MEHLAPKGPNISLRSTTAQKVSEHGTKLKQGNSSRRLTTYIYKVSVSQCCLPPLLLPTNGQKNLDAALSVTETQHSWLTNQGAILDYILGRDSI